MKSALKSLANVVALVLVLPAFLLYRAAALLAGKDRAFPGWSQAFALLPGVSGAYLRRAFYRLTLKSCSPDCWLGFGVIFSHAGAEVGRRVYVGPFCCLGEVTLEDDVLLGSHVSVMNGSQQHGIDRLDVPIREQPGNWVRVKVGRDSWVGDRALVLADVGEHCVIGAGAVVSKAVPDFAIAVGVPARVVRFRNQPAAGESPGEGVEGS
jgi:acetyltransferase-like isoleucine patch superfamily enzyme